MERMIEAEQLSCKIGRNYLLKAIDWQVIFGEQWIVYGMNGSGKTTLLSIVAGYRHFTGGRLKVLGQAYCPENVLAMRRKIGFVSSSFFDKHYNGEKVLDIVLSGLTGCLGLAEDLTLADAVMARQCLRDLNMADKADKPFDLLSKGKRQIVLLARALLSRPSLLILDEPMSGLDIYNREYLFRILEVLKDKVTMIYVTHQAEEISAVFNRCLLLKNGRIFAQGDLEETFTAANLSGLLGHRALVETDRLGRKRLSLDMPAAHGSNFCT